MAHEETKPISTFHPETDGHRGAKTVVTPTTTQYRYHAGFGDTSGENALPDAGGPTVLHQRDKKR
jgi:hypothetical protein